ncbi:hypothetical protein [Streptacidiphilus sp. PAMC 29251]
MDTQPQSNGATGPHRGRRSNRLRTLAAAAALAALAAGGCASCASGSAGTPAASMSPGMQMSAMPQAAAAPSATGPSASGTSATGPSATALMVCGKEIKEAVTTILAPPKAPTTTSTWADHLYTCTYHLPTGQLVLSVKESPDTATGTAYFEAQRKQLGTTTPLTVAQGLGNPGFESAGGTVVILKDGKTLRVDATGMPAASGPNQLSRADLAYEVGSDVLGCWSE